MAPAPDRSTTTSVLVDGVPAGTTGFHPRMVPLSVANRKRAGPACGPCPTTNSGPPLNTVPVGAPATCTTSDWGMPAPSYSVERSVPLSATHHGVVGPAARPHALTRFGSVCAAWPGRSDTSFVTRYEFEAARAPAPGLAASALPANRAI